MQQPQKFINFSFFQNEMYSLWALNRKLEKEIEAIMLSIQTKRTEIAIDQLMNAQVCILGPKFCSNYNTVLRF